MKSGKKHRQKEKPIHTFLAIEFPYNILPRKKKQRANISKEITTGGKNGTLELILLLKGEERELATQESEEELNLTAISEIPMPKQEAVAAAQCIIIIMLTSAF